MGTGLSIDDFGSGKKPPLATTKEILGDFFHPSVYAKLNSGDHKLSHEQTKRLKRYVAGYMDSDSARFPNRKGVSANELVELMDVVKSDKSFTPKQHERIHREFSNLI